MNPNPELLPSLRRLTRGLSALFWGLPVALIVCAQTARTDALQAVTFFPPVIVTGWLFFSLRELGQFQKQERIWRTALQRAKYLALVNLGLAPFLYWWNQSPAEPFFNQMVAVLMLTALLFLSELNLVLRRLTAMLPDETLRVETREFTAINRAILAATLMLVAVDLSLNRLAAPPAWLAAGLDLLERRAAWLLIFMVLLPLAMTMALLWKIKNVLLASVFGAKI